MEFRASLAKSTKGTKSQSVPRLQSVSTDFARLAPTSVRGGLATIVKRLSILLKRPLGATIEFFARTIELFAPTIAHGATAI